MIIGYKKALTTKKSIPVIVTLGIPENGKHNIKRKLNNKDPMFAKHRCDKCIVLDIFDPVTGRIYQEATSNYLPDGAKPLRYVKGEIVRSEYDPDENKVCSKGIHFFLSLVRARLYASPFVHDTFRCWHDNGNLKFMADVTRDNVFSGSFIEYDDETGNPVREFKVYNNTVMNCRLVLKERFVNFYSNTKIQDIFPELSKYA